MFVAHLFICVLICLTEPILTVLTFLNKLALTVLILRTVLMCLAELILTYYCTDISYCTSCTTIYAYMRLRTISSL
jgi:hypothetical protein